MPFFVALLKQLQLRRFEGAQVDSHLFAARRPDEDQEPLPIGQELRPTMEDVSPTRIEPRCRNGSAARSRNARQDARRNSSKEDHPFPAPGASAPEPGVAKNLDRTALELDPLQLVLGEEGERPAVGRPERILGLFGPGQRASL